MNFAIKCPCTCSIRLRSLVVIKRQNIVYVTYNQNISKVNINMDQFSSKPSVSLEKSIDTSTAFVETNPADIDRVYELERCIGWITENNYKKVCLQFPDYLLPDSSEIASRLQKRLGQVVYIMGDSAYESCCIDYLTAQHVNSDAIIHFGPRCLSNWTNIIPCLCIYEKAPLNVELFSRVFAGKFDRDTDMIDVILDTPYIHLKTDIVDLFSANGKVNVNSIDEKLSKINHHTVVYIGKNDRKLLNLRLKYKKIPVLYYYDPQENEPEIKNCDENNAILKRRRFLAEKIKDSETVAIIIATVVIENFTKSIDRIKNLLKSQGKRYYILSVGRPTATKLANFPEMDLYVLICCPMSDIFESRDFYKPIVAPYDIEIALNPKADRLQFTYDVDAGYLDEGIEENCVDDQPDVSLLTGNLRYRRDIEDDSGDGKEVAVKDKGAMAVSDRSGAAYLAKRSFQGLEQKLGESEVKLAVEGRKGLPRHYENESY